MASALPSYENPPVVETVLGVEFAPLDDWKIQHFGLFWQDVREDFPKADVQPPLASQIESFDIDPGMKGDRSRVELLEHPEVRCWYVSEDDQRLIQVQRERFIYNWRRGMSEAEYPRYEQHVRPAFERNWLRYNEFLAREGLPQPYVRQCEVTYVNHIPKGDGWTNVGEWDQVFTILGRTRDAQFLQVPEAARLNLNYVMPAQKGRLRITANHAIRKRDGVQIIALNLTARGRPESSQTDDILRWFDTGREWIVRGFTDLTSDKMHEIWRRIA